MRTFLKILLVIIIIAAVGFLVFKCTQAKSVEKSKNTSAAYNYRLKNFYPESKNNFQIIEHKAFSLQYNEQTEQASWVVYLLTSQMVNNKVVKRSDKFKPDPKVTSESATPTDYRKSGYDKGHLCPAGDMTWDMEANLESFYMSNMSPQKPGFNRGMWRELEEQVREWALQNDSLIVITGPVFERNIQYIGTNEVGIPSAYYKIVADISYPSYKTIAFIMPNKEEGGSFYKYTVAIDSIEAVLQLNFFKNYPNLNALENKNEVDNWK